MNRALLLCPPDTVQLTVVVPTYREAAGITGFLERLLAALERSGRTFEVIVVDDASPDGTADLADAALPERLGRVLRRQGPRSLSRSVLDGFGAARGECLAVMDADGSHPPELLERLLAEVQDGADVAWASRTTQDGSAPGLSWVRQLVSGLAGSLVAGLTPVSDPTSGFFLLRREVIEGVTLDPIGWKIGLEVLCRGRASKVAEVPFRFEERAAGRSKFGLGPTLDYLRHLLRLRADVAPPLPAAAPTAPLWRELLPVVAVALLAFFALLGRQPLTDPDEGLHALVGRNMLERGDLLVPYEDHAAWLDKPALFFTTVAASYRLLGATELAARLPGALFSLGTVVLTLLIGRRLYGGRAGLIGALVLTTSGLPLALARAVAPDTALTFFTTAALGAFAAAFAARPVRRGWFLLGGAATAMAFLCKGAPGLAVPAVGLGAGLVLVGALRRVREAPLALAAAGVAAVGLTWALLVERRSPGFLWYFFVERTVLGFFTPTQRHGGEPLLFYVPVVALGLFPWVIFLPRALHEAGGAALRRRWPDAVLLGTAAGVVALFTLASSKLPTYVLPAFPALALLIGAHLERAAGAPSLHVRAGGAVVLVGGAAVACVVGATRWSLAPGDLAPLVVVALLSAGAWWALSRRGGPWVWGTLCGIVVAVTLTAFATIGPEVAHRYSARRLADAAQRLLPPGTPVFTFKKRPRSFEFYTGRPLAELTQNDLLERVTHPGRIYFVIKRSNLPELEPLLAGVATPLADGGSHILYVGGTTRP